MSERERFDPELIRKLSKTVLHASERRRQSLFEKMTASNAEKIAKMMQEKPIFYENKEEAPRRVLLDEEVAEALPPEFFENPTEWIESQPNIERGYGTGDLPSGENIEELWYQSYDITKVKTFKLKTKDGEETKVVSKRIKKEQLDEVARARKAYEAGIPTPRVLGEIMDKGNVYAFYEHLPGVNLDVAWQKINKKTRGLLHLGILQSIYDENEVRRDLAEKPISEAARDSLYTFWEPYRDLIKQNEILVVLLDYLTFEYEPRREFENRARETILESRFNIEEIEEVLKKLNFENLEEYIHSIPKTFEEGVKFYQKLKEKAYVKNIRKQINKYVHSSHAKVREVFFGFDYEKETQRLERMCREKGIEHKDLASRNLMVLWDFEKDEPLPRGKDEPKLYIIDWELERKSPNNTKN